MFNRSLDSQIKMIPTELIKKPIGIPMKGVASYDSSKPTSNPFTNSQDPIRPITKSEVKLNNTCSL